MTTSRHDPKLRYKLHENLVHVMSSTRGSAGLSENCVLREATAKYHLGDTPARKRAYRLARDELLFRKEGTP